MVIPIGNKFIILTIFQGKESTLEQSYQWSRWLMDVRSLAMNTANVYARAVERFWIWSLYNQPTKDEHFALYFAKYVKQLKTGFTITEKQEDINGELDVQIFVSKSLSDETINKEIAGVESFLQYTNMDQLIHSDNLNLSYERKKAQRSFLGSIEIKASERYLKAFGKKETYIRKKKIRAKSRHDIKAFPYKLFMMLLSVSKPREQLIYILAGITSARIGQILNFTMYDIDYNKKEIWLIDPKSSEKDIYGRARRKWLLEKYNIDITMPSIHNNMANQFKYPIPKTRGPLHWISEDMKELFFELMLQYKNSEYFVPEYTRAEKHPFFFVTSTGKRLIQSQVYATFQANLYKLRELLSKKNEDYTTLYNIKGVHSLRHMAGTIMADIYSKENKDIIVNITKDMFGHSSLESTMIYFENTPDEKLRLLKKAGEAIFSQNSKAV